MNYLDFWSNALSTVSLAFLNSLQGFTKEKVKMHTFGHETGARSLELDRLTSLYHLGQHFERGARRKGKCHLSFEHTNAIQIQTLSVRK